MTDKRLEQFDQAGAAIESVLAEVKTAQLDQPTPCTDWSVRQLANHVVTGNLMFTGMITGGAPADGGADHVGDDPLGAFQKTFALLRAAFAADGVLERTFPTPMGERPAARLVTTRVVEMSLHGWDLAKATGQVIDLPPAVVETALGALSAMLPADRSGMPFGSEQQVPADTSPADRLAAFAGRHIA
ncbi:TIGR03086 family metal-binding protein [Streptomyces beijiangensis]|uniref:TIGR03086 family protein n=1 Tax=Streptomyces beijiangensis TaxID=163361 RepID=A0A939JJQ4_9ACTN|nr:TIGR03086 family metal-binding protein [Streptomyces beijiangensis]MBO0514505.1 TIGR03086 family protein [Streptomyces beijiangensis]